MRSRDVLRGARRPGFAGVLAIAPGALWLSGGADPVSRDVVVGYPSVDRAALRGWRPTSPAAAVTLMVDSTDQLDLVDAVVPPGSGRRPDLLDVDASLRLAGGRLHVGVRRSPSTPWTTPPNSPAPSWAGADSGWWA